MIWVAPAQTARIVVLPWVVMWFLAGQLQSQTPDDWAKLAIAVVYLGLAGWILIAWHRYALLGETNNLPLPRWNGRQFVRYVLWAFGLGVILLLPVSIVAAAREALLFSVPLSDGTVLASMLLQPAGVVLTNFIFWRLGLVLPAAAVCSLMTFCQSWALTAVSRRSILTLSLLVAALDWLLQLQYDASSWATTRAVLAELGFCIIFLFNASILTVLYAELVQEHAPKT